MKNILVIMFLLSFLFMMGCAGGKMMLTASKVKYPVSTSSALYSPKGEIIDNEDYTLQGKFKRNYDRWSIFWTLIPFSSYKRDMSNDLSEAIMQKNGDAIVNLKVKVGQNFYNGFVTFTFINHIPLIPTLHRVQVTGDIVKIKK